MSDQPRGSGLATLAIHAGAATPRWPARLDATADDPLGLSPSRASGAIDGCVADPSCAALEECIAALEGGSAALAVMSGQVARFLVAHALLQPGDEIVVARQPGGRHDPQIEHGFAGFGWQVRWADAASIDSFLEALSDRTKAIFIESIAQADGTITDIEATANVARRARVPLVVDNTAATPYLLRPFEHGADIVLHASMGWLSGTSRSVGGLIVDGGGFEWIGDARYPTLSRPMAACNGQILGESFGNFAFATACRMVGQRDLGPALSPPDAQQILDGIATLPLRMQRYCDNALAVAQHLSRHPTVAAVHYAGLDDDPHHALARRYCPSGAGPIVGVHLAGGVEASPAFTERLKLFSADAGLGDTRSRIIRGGAAQQPHGDLDPVLLSIGLEDSRDIIADLDQALG